jgi:hypothetical protein
LSEGLWDCQRAVDERMVKEVLIRLFFFMETTFTRRMRWIATGIFLALFLFELGNLLGILQFQVEYTWKGRVFSTAFVFCVASLIDWVIGFDDITSK